MKNKVFLVVLGIVVASFFQFSEYEAQCAPEVYKIGLTGSVTGPAAGTHDPLCDGFSLYINRLNAKGGINGRKVELIFENNAGSGVKAGANVQRFGSEKAHLVLVSGPSGIYASSFEEAKRTNIPVLVLAVGPNETVPPQAMPLVYGQLFGNAKSMPKIVATIVKEQVAPKVKKPVWGVVGIDIPVSRKGAETEAEIGKTFGVETVVKIVPMGVTDYSAVATSLMDAGCNIVSTYGPAGLTIGVFKALNKLGYKGMLAIDSPDAPENFIDLLQEIPSITVASPNLVPLSADYPIDKEIKEAAEKRNMRVNSRLKSGWWYGMIAEEVLKRAGWPVTTEKLVGILNNADFDFTPAFLPVRYTATDHQGPVCAIMWSWNTKEKKFIPVTDWYCSNAEGTIIKKYPKDIGAPKVRFD